MKSSKPRGCLKSPWWDTKAELSRGCAGCSRAPRGWGSCVSAPFLEALMLFRASPPPGPQHCFHCREIPVISGGFVEAPQPQHDPDLLLGMLFILSISLSHSHSLPGCRKGSWLVPSRFWRAKKPPKEVRFCLQPPSRCGQIWLWSNLALRCQEYQLNSFFVNGCPHWDVDEFKDCSVQE